MLRASPDVYGAGGRKQVWLLYDKDSPSCFAEELADMERQRVKKACKYMKAAVKLSPPQETDY